MNPHDVDALLRDEGDGKVTPEDAAERLKTLIGARKELV